MRVDDQGFMYPEVDSRLCIQCNLCEKVCPVINQSSPREPIHTYAAKNTDDKVRISSSSGGIFHALAKKTIEEKGVIFGAKFNDKWEVVHDYAETVDDIKAFQGSKYVQSRTGDTFLQAEKFLKAGRKVMFTGTPCQIAALGLYLKKDYGEQLLKVDVVCHGVPSPLVWNDYLKYITHSHSTAYTGSLNSPSSPMNSDKITVTGISFRDKRISWERFGLSVRAVTSWKIQNKQISTGTDTSEDYELLFETLDKNLFMQGFLKNLYLRPSCYKCPTKQLKSGSDITLADFWGISSIDAEAHDNSGISLVLANTEKGNEILKSLNNWYKSEVYASAAALNSAITYSCKHPKNYSKFWAEYPVSGINAIARAIKEKRPLLPVVIFRMIKGKMSSITKQMR